MKKIHLDISTACYRVDLSIQQNLHRKGKKSQKGLKEKVKGLQGVVHVCEVNVDRSW